MSNNLIEAAISLLNSGDDEGCDGLVVVSAEAFRRLQAAVQETVGQHHGIQLDEADGDGDSTL